MYSIFAKETETGEIHCALEIKAPNSLTPLIFKNRQSFFDMLTDPDVQSKVKEVKFKSYDKYEYRID